MGLAFSSYRDDPCTDGYGQSDEKQCPNCKKCVIPIGDYWWGQCPNCGYMFSPKPV